MKNSPKMQLDSLKIKSFVTSISTNVIRGGIEDSDGPQVCQDEIDSGHEICTLDSCIGSTTC